MDNHRGEPEPADGCQPADVADSALLRQFVATGDEHAFGTIVHRHSGLVMGVCRRTLRDGHDAEEAFQATFFVLAKKAGQVQAANSLAPWLYGVAYRVAVRAAQQRARRRESELPDNIMTIDDALEQVAECHWRRVLDDELNQLPEKYRGALVLHYLLGKTNKEVAVELGLSVRTIEGRQRRGKELLKRRQTFRKVGLPMALGALAATQVASAQASAQLVTSTIQASLSFAHGTSAACSAHAARLAQSEVLAMTSAVAPVSMTLVTLLAIGAGVALSGGHAPAHGQGGAGPLSAAVLALADTTGSETKSADTADSIPFTVSADKGATETKAAAPKDGAPYARIDAGDRFDLYQRSDGEKKIVASLAANLTASLDFNGAPLAEAVAMIAESYGVPIVFDNQALDAVAITPDVPVTISLRDIPLRSALRLMLKQASSDLTYIVRDDVLLITTRDAAEATHETHIYDLRNVLDMLGAKLPSVAESIPNTVVPESWQDNGTGDGTIATLGDFYLAVNQTQEVHEELAKFLAQIERRGALEKSSHEASTGSRY